MDEQETPETVAAATEMVIALEAELEAAGEAKTGGDELAHSHAMLHEWVESVVAVVSSPGVGRVTLIHRDGAQTSIASPTLPFLLSRPARFGA